MIYCADTSFWIRAWDDLYRPSKFPTIWDDLKGMIEKGEIISPMEVKRELKPKDPSILKWFKDCEKVFVELNEAEQKYLMELLGRFPRLNVAGRTVEDADPYVIAMGKIKNAVVLSDENPSGDRRLASDSSIAKKIPDVCTALSVECLKVEQFINQLPGPK